MNLDRFSQGLPDPQEQEPKIVGKCRSCRAAILEGEEVYQFPDGALVCDDRDCVAKEAGAEKVTAGEDLG